MRIFWTNNGVYDMAKLKSSGHLVAGKMKLQRQNYSENWNVRSIETGKAQHKNHLHSDTLGISILKLSFNQSIIHIVPDYHVLWPFSNMAIKYDMTILFSNVETLRCVGH